MRPSKAVVSISYGANNGNGNCMYSQQRLSGCDLCCAQKREVLRREEEVRKRREDEKKNALKVSSSYSERLYESAMAKITKAAARLERNQVRGRIPRSCRRPRRELNLAFKREPSLSGQQQWRHSLGAPCASATKSPSCCFLPQAV